MDHERHERDIYPASADLQQDDEYYRQRLEEIERAKLRRQRADQLAKDRLHAELIMIGAALFIIFLIIMLILRAGKKKQENTEFHNSTMAQASASQADNGLGEEPQETAPTGKTVPEYQGGDGAVDGDSPYKGQAEGHSLVTKNGVTYVDGIMIVNKTFSLPKDYNPGLDPAAQTAFNNMAAAAWGEGISLWICSGFRTYDEQDQLFDSYASARGLDEADEVSARPGHSEHQSGLCMDVNSTEFEFANTAESQWLETHCAEYGFIIRFPQGKESFTGYAYEPWHIRYVGVETAMAMKTSGQCLEEYLGVTSDYKDSLENEDFVKKYSGSGTADTEPAQTEAPADEWTYNDGGQQDYGYDNGYGQDQGYDYGYGYDDGYNYDYNYDWGY